VGRENESDLVLALPQDRNANMVNIAQYGNCMEAQRKPSRERHGWVM
jgi:hypothetical protein